MIVQCADCGKEFDDLDHTYVCPHPYFEASPDALQALQKRRPITEFDSLNRELGKVRQDIINDLTQRINRLDRGAKAYDKQIEEARSIGTPFDCMTGNAAGIRESINELKAVRRKLEQDNEGWKSVPIPS